MQADTFCAGQMKSEQGNYLPTISPFRKGLCLRSVGLFDAWDIVGCLHRRVHSSSVSLASAKGDTELIGKQCLHCKKKRLSALF